MELAFSSAASKEWIYTWADFLHADIDVLILG